MTTFSVNSKSQLAKLLATENLTIQHQKIVTARFDISNRILYCPIWNDMSGDLYDLLLGHEVGHAMETPEEGWHDAINNGVTKKYKNFLNVVEDSRIEKKIKRRYPGLRGNFVRGYKSLVDRNFFGTEGRDVNKLPFIDRLNLYTKAGSLIGINFSDDEMKMVRRVESAETWQDVLDVTAVIYSYSGDEQRELHQQNRKLFDCNVKNDESEIPDEQFDESYSNSGTDEEEDGDEIPDEQFDESYSNSGTDEEEDGDEIPDEQFDESYYSSGPGGDDENFEPRCLTDEIFRSKEKVLLSTECKEYVYVNIPEPNLKQIITHYNRVHEQMEENFSKYDKLNGGELYSNFKSKNDRYISLLAKEFEMRKAAKSYAKTKILNTGDINASNLWKYQIDDRIFKKIQYSPKGKSHGLVMLLDCSASMLDNMSGSIEQSMVLVSFCRKVNIPFVLYGFGDSGHSRSCDFPNELRTGCFSRKPNDLCLGSVYLREYINSRMSTSEFSRCMKNLACLRKTYEFGFGHMRPLSESLSGTPLNESMVAIKFIVQDFRKKNNLDLVNLVIVHDGDSSSECNRISREYSIVTNYFNVSTQNVIIRDTKNKIEIQLNPNIETSLENREALRAGIFEWFTRATSANIFGFFIIGKKSNTRRAIYKRYIGKNGETAYDSRGSLTKALIKYLNKNKFVQSFNKGYTLFFMIPGGNGLNVGPGELFVDGAITRSKLLTAFSKTMRAKHVNRVLVSKFIQGISGRIGK